MDDIASRINASAEAQNVALHLFNLIAKAEHWWDSEGEQPSGDRILTRYAQCVAATRGELPMADREPDVVFDKFHGEQAPNAHHNITAYHATRDLIAEAEPEDPAQLISLNEPLSLDV